MNAHEPQSRYLEPYSNALLCLAQARLLEAPGSPPPPSGTAVPSQRQRVELLVKSMRHDPEFLALPGFVSDIREIELEFERFVSSMLDDVLALGPLGSLLADREVTEILVNGPGAVFYEKGGRRVRGRSFLDASQVRAVLERLLEQSGEHLASLAPLGEARLRDGGQIHVALPPVAPEGVSFNIRRVPGAPPALLDLVKAGAITRQVALFLLACVRARINIVVTGSSRAGKSWMLNALCNAVDASERVIVVEERWQLNLTAPDRVSLQANTRSGMDLLQLVRAATRMQPDRIVVGQCSGAEVLELLLAMNAGYEGSFTSAFASSPRDLVDRFLMFSHLAGQGFSDEKLERQIATSVDLIVHMQRLPDGQRICSTIVAVDPAPDGAVMLTEVFTLVPDEPAPTLSATGMVPRFFPQLEKSGVRLPANLLAAPTAPRAPDAEDEPRKPRRRLVKRDAGGELRPAPRGRKWRTQTPAPGSA